MILARALRLLLAAALLIAWQGALVHPLAHVGDQGELVHLKGGQHGDPQATSDPLCDAIAALSIAIGGGRVPLGIAAFGAEASNAGQDFARAGALRLAYRSQAPPQFS